MVGETILGRVVKLAQKAKCFDAVWVATSTDTEDAVTEEIAKRYNAACIRGSLLDVRSRFAEIIIESQAEIVCRLTADNPLTYLGFILDGMAYAEAHPQVPYVMFDHDKIPYGSGVEIFRTDPFKESLINDLSPEGIEHVTYSLRKLPQAVFLTPSDKIIERSDLKVTVDTIEDYLRVYNWFSRYGADLDIMTLCKNEKFGGSKI